MKYNYAWLAVETYTPDDTRLNRGREVVLVEDAQQIEEIERAAGQELPFTFAVQTAARAHALLHGGTVEEAVKELLGEDIQFEKITTSSIVGSYAANDGEYRLVMVVATDEQLDTLKRVYLNE